MFEKKKFDKKSLKKSKENAFFLLIFSVVFSILVVCKWGKVARNGVKWSRSLGKGGEA